MVYLIILLNKTCLLPEQRLKKISSEEKSREAVPQGVYKIVVIKRYTTVTLYDCCDLFKSLCRLHYLLHLDDIIIFKVCQHFFTEDMIVYIVKNTL